ncbi:MULTISPECIES: flavoprotein [Streptomyces]|uniref:Flavoprotein n=1 Tax=Streptomyces tsukubensis (strain DSM 42081 / NBRC 108919 / NRRL 18488 / 9993) TaxID=1114943 RepID=I2N183_STRT9|nr:MULTISPECIES: flavoprotein [Streptomyces]AZK94949.1 flavoprotein [Streptomyces tsukubensis]EIF90780.1 flavoprotein [Streptomyces tsukubensis NRRL18488]MYS64817.1 flavoprotein [Streptomyces sp. SID5473]QKM68976.1 flavoprotein [Streptomyces tsukubensis NRRL18488]TAI40808.1 flavoprotein [Streptomyces tsukubensis]
MKTMYLFGSAAPPVIQSAEVIASARERGWDVCLGLTPAAAEWLHDDLPGLEKLTGHPVRSRYKRPGEPDVWPRADVILFAPVTANSLSSWALCLTSNFVIGVVAEGIGKGIPVVAMPCVNAAYAAHRRVERSITELREMGVTVLYGDGGFVPNPPGERHPYPWDIALAAAEAAVRHDPSAPER